MLMNRTALFPRLLGEKFTSLEERVQAVHGGGAGRWQGIASVQRGSIWLMRVAAAIARLPTSVRDVPTTVHIDVQGEREVWTRCFGDARPMRSVLSAHRGLLVERLGLIAMTFRVVTRDGGINWELLRIAFLGVPLPRRWFQVHARSEYCERGYRFSVAARVVGVGELIRYDGQLLVPRGMAGAPAVGACA
jgi:hypothetical protein